MLCFSDFISVKQIVSLNSDCAVETFKFCSVCLINAWYDELSFSSFPPSTVQRPHPARTSHWRVGTTVTRDLGSHWTNSVTLVQTVLSATTKATYVVSTPWDKNTAVDTYVQEERSCLLSFLKSFTYQKSAQLWSWSAVLSRLKWSCCFLPNNWASVRAFLT